MSSIYSQYDSSQLEELFSHYLIDSWSYSRVSLFARNEKEFERTQIYCEPQKRSASSVAGNAYHEAVAMYFNCIKEGQTTDIIEMQALAFGYIDNIPANVWKIQKTTPTVQDCVETAVKTVNTLIQNFLTDVSDVYMTGSIEEVLCVEEHLDAWLTISGQDIPLPCHGVPDVGCRLIDGKVILVDHKSKAAYTSEEEVILTHGKQAIIYVKLFESKYPDIKVDEVWFIENKPSKNKDGSPQCIKHTLPMDDNSRKLYEMLLYEPLRQMLLAVSDPDHVYKINDYDTLSDRAELYEFWMRTLIAEVEDFNIKDNKKELIAKRLKKIRDAEIASINPRIISEFRRNAAEFIQYDYSSKEMTDKEKIEHVLRSFGIITQVTHVIDGWSSDTYLLEINPGTKIANIERYKLDIANALNVSTVLIRRELQIYEGKSYLSIEKSKKRTRDLLFEKKYLNGKNIPIGLNNFNETIYWNVENNSTPHMLICGATGSGKSVSIRSTIEYCLQAGFSDVIIFDPKYEFGAYNGQKHCSVFQDIEEIEDKMSELVDQMQQRVKKGVKKYTLVVFDEFADALSQSRSGRELDIVNRNENGKMIKTGKLKSLEENLRILLQKGRSSGYRIIAATQRASTKIITGDAKVNFPVQICFRVPKSIDSKVVLDEEGAEALSGAGDGLMHSPEYLGLVRFQAFLKQ